MVWQASTRRGTLRRIGATLAAGGAVVGAGCSGGDDAETPDSTATADSPAPGTTPAWTGPAFGRWLPAPETVIPVADYQFGLLDLTEYDDHGVSLPPGVQGVVDSWAPLELDWRTVPFALTLHGNNVLRADFERSALESQVEGAEGWTRSDSYEGYALFASDQAAEAIAIGEETIVRGQTRDDAAAAREIARGIIDTSMGRIETYPAHSEAVNAVLDELATDGFSRMWLPIERVAEAGQGPALDGQVGLGRWGRFNEGAPTDVKLVLAFERPDAADPEAVRSYVENHSDDGEQFAPWQDLRIRKRERLVVIEGAIPRDASPG